MKKDRSELLRQRVALRGRPRAPQPLPATGTARPDSVPNRAGHLVEAFAAVVAEFPDRVAVQDGERSWTYRQLDQVAGQLAVALGAVASDPGRPVGILLERSAWMVAAALAVVRTGSSYVPLDPETPRARLELIVEDAGPAALITSRAFAGQVPDGVPAVFVDDPLPEAGTEAPEPTIDRDTRAYIIFTSGTTGRPKGVQVSHGNVLSLLSACEEGYDFGPEDVWTLVHSFAFDFSVFEMWGALLYGGRLVVVSEQTAMDPVALRRLLRDEQVTVLCQTPAAFHQLAAEDIRFADRLPLRWVIFGGEALHFSDLAQWFGKYGDDAPRLVNMYGITETTVHASFRRVRSEDLRAGASLIGHPLPGLGFLLVDDGLCEVAEGEVGEIVVTGPGVSLGYLKRPELNRDRFVELPEGRGRGYRSGDLARLTPTGEYEYRGRKDDQVKIRGFRIELGEIEQALHALPSLAEAAVVARDLPGRGNSLVAYVVPAGEASLSAETLHGALAATLPDYMIPRVFVRLDRLPLTQNGKADRKTLPEPTVDSTLNPRGTGREEEPADAVEERVLRIVTDLLHLDRADPTAGFFDLGGHSLLATRLLAGVRAAFDVEVPLREFLREPTPRALAAVVRERLAEPSRGRSRVVGIVRAPEATHPPATDAQRRLYFLSQLEPDSPAYHLHTTLLLEGGLDAAEALERAFAAVIERHAPLRTVLRVEDGELTQVVRPTEPFRLLPEELPQYPGEDWRRSVDRLAQRESVRPFDLGSDSMLRVRLVRVAPALHILLVTAHHIATDGWSIAVLSRELKTLYAHFRKNPQDARLPLAPLPYTYVDYAYSMQRWLSGPDWQEDLAYWEERLAALPTVHRLPLDSPRPARTHAGDTVTTHLAGPVADAVRRTCREEDVTLFTFLQAAFSLLLARRSGSDDIVVGSPVANRPTAELDDVIGMFVNTVVLRTRLDGAATFRELLTQVREQTIRDLERQHVPLSLLLKRLNPPHSADHAPLFQIMLVLQNNEAAVLDLDGLDVTPVPSPDPGTQAELMLDAVEEAGDLTFRWRYNTSLFRRDSITGLADEFGRLLTHLSSAAAARTAPLEQTGRPAAPASAGRSPKTSPGDHPALVRLRQNPAGAPPVFALPGVLGLGESFAQLSSHFQDRSFYALSTADLVRKNDGHQTAAALAGECARIIAAVADGSPLHIVGHSYGGSLGFHVAEELHERGVPVAGLVLLDAVHPAALAKALSGSYDDQFLTFLATLGGLFPDLARHRDTDLRELLRTESTASVLKRVESIIGPPAVEFFQGGLETAFDTYRRTCDLNWPEPRAADHPALFVRADGTDGRASADRPSGWARYLPGTLRVERIDADHEGMLRNPHARRLAELLQQFLTAHDAPHDIEKPDTKSLPGKGATAR